MSLDDLCARENFRNFQLLYFLEFILYNICKNKGAEQLYNQSLGIRMYIYNFLIEPFYIYT